MASKMRRRSKIADSINASVTQTGCDGVTRDRAHWTKMKEACLDKSKREKSIAEQEKKSRSLWQSSSKSAKSARPGTGR